MTKVLLLNSQLNESREKLNELFSGHIVLLDRTDQITRSLNFNNHGDFIVIEPKEWKISKTGNLSGIKKERVKEITNSAIKTTGDKTCGLNLETIATTDFQHDVYPSLKNACINCHVNLDIISLFNNRENIKKWSSMMLKTMRLGKMPGGSDTEYMNDITSTKPRDLKVVSQWLRQGAEISQDDEKFIIKEIETEKQKETDKFNSRKADLVLEAEEITVPATGPDFQKTYKFKLPIPDDTHLEEAFIETNLNVAHHHQLTASKAELEEKEEHDGFKYKYTDALPVETYIDKNLKRGYLFNYKSIVGVLRKKGFVWVSNGKAFPLIDKNSYLYLNVHYVSSGKEEKNKPKIHLFYKKPESPKTKTLHKILFIPSKRDFFLPKGKKDFNVTMKYVLDKPVYFVKYTMHAHYRAISGRMKFKLPGEKNYRYQASIPYYQFKLPAEVIPVDRILLPKGTEIISEMIFDNSSDNSANPDPEKDIKVGLSSYESEMSYAQMMYEDAE